MDSKRELIDSFWNERVKRHGTDPRANTNDVWLRTIEIEAVEEVLRDESSGSVLDFGCANGFSTLELSRLLPDTQFVGVDINEEMISAAKDALRRSSESNVEFRTVDLEENSFTGNFDAIVCVRVFQNMPSLTVQCKIFSKLLGLLRENGVILLIETYREAYGELNHLREQLGLPQLPAR